MAKLQTEEKTTSEVVTLRLPSDILNELDERRIGAINGAATATRAQYIVSILKNAFNIDLASPQR